jgi:hypothetical protein
VFRSCRNWLDEFRTFARDENGHIINEPKYHLMAATRYLLLDTLSQWKPEVPKPPQQERHMTFYGIPRSDQWMA